MLEGCSLGMALQDVLDAEESLSPDEKEALMKMTEDIFMNHLVDACRGQKKAPPPRGRVKMDEGLYITATVDEYSNYMDDWTLRLRGTVAKQDGEILNPCTPVVEAKLQRMERRKKKRKAAMIE
ncbi:unnamed protein product [Aphanomyces euteiches]